MLEWFNFSLVTLLFFNVLPFFYFGYHVKFRFWQERLKRFDFFLAAACIVLAGVVLVRISNLSVTLSRNDLLLGFLHLAPLILSLLLISSKSSLSFGSRAAAPRQASGNLEETSGYAPQPLNTSVENLSWKDLVISKELREELQSVIDLLREPQTAKRYGVEAPKGLLLYGPSGTGKTTIAKVIASSAELAFFALRMDEVISKWVGESEKNLSRLFQAALKHAPAVIFIDEVDSIGRMRSSGGQQWSENLLNHLLQLIDGVIKTEGLYLIAATNRVDLVDPALKRSGRLSKTLEIPLPDFNARGKLLALFLSKLKLASSVDLTSLARITDGRSGADLHEICNRAGINAFKRESGSGRRDYLVTQDDLESAVDEVLSSNYKPGDL